MEDNSLAVHPAAQAETETLILKPSKGWTALNLRDLWRYRELAFFLTWRDIKVRYKQTFFGAAWAVVQPLAQMLIFNFLFGNLAVIPTNGIPRPIFTYSALLPWNLFSKALSDAGRSLVASRNMITKIYFPRLIIPMSTILSGVVDFAIAFVVLLGMMFYYDITPTSAVWTLPLFLLLALVTALGVGLWLSAWNVHYRDVGHFIPFLTQFWLLASPIAYPLSQIPEEWKMAYSLNPMVGVVEGFRWALLGTESLPGQEIWISVGISLVLLVSGLFYFRSMERTFADIV
ncbi:MAG: ABC transporter permease [Anaerolineae bacterium]|nr:ABC transporter permease [Anaerolineae bacterium]